MSRTGVGDVISVLTFEGGWGGFNNQSVNTKPVYASPPALDVGDTHILVYIKTGI